VTEVFGKGTSVIQGIRMCLLVGLFDSTPFSYTTLLEKSILKNSLGFWESKLMPSRSKICLFLEAAFINSCLLR